MNPLDHQIDRLFRAAAQATPEKSFSPSYGMETRMVAEWRTVKPFDIWDMSLLVRGLILAGLIAIISLWPMLNTTKSANPFSDYLSLADSTVQMDISAP